MLDLLPASSLRSETLTFSRAHQLQCALVAHAVFARLDGQRQL